VGAGRIGELAAGNLSARGASIAYVANRSADGAAELATRFGASRSLSTIVAGKLAEVDVVLTSTAAPGLVIRRATCRHAAAARCSSSTLPFHATSIPRCTSSTAATSTTSTISRRSSTETLEGRRAEAEVAERLVVEEAERFREWRASLDVVPAIASLRSYAEEIRSAELAKYASLPEEERRRIAAVSGQILNKLLHEPTVRMKQAAAAGDGEAYAEAIRRLFGLSEVMVVRIGSRGSRLAITQAELAAAIVRRAGHDRRFIPITTAGDRDRSSRSGRSAPAGSSSRRSRKRCSPTG